MAKTNQELKIDLLFLTEEYRDRYSFWYSDQNGYDAFGDILGINLKPVSDEKNIR